MITSSEIAPSKLQ